MGRLLYINTLEHPRLVGGEWGNDFCIQYKVFRYHRVSLADADEIE